MLLKNVTSDIQQIALAMIIIMMFMTFPCVKGLAMKHEKDEQEEPLEAKYTAPLHPSKKVKEESSSKFQQPLPSVEDKNFEDEQFLGMEKNISSHSGPQWGLLEGEIDYLFNLSSI